MTSFRHAGVAPTVDPTAYVAPTAVLSGDVRVGAHARVLHGAVLTAEGGSVTVGEHVIVMENAVLRGTAKNALEIGAHSVVGVAASIVGARIADRVFIASGARVFNGAVLGSGAEVRIGATVHLRTTLERGATVPIGWIAVGTPAQLFSPQQHAELWEVQKALDFPGYVFGVDRDGPDPMGELTERWSSALAAHLDDEQVESVS